MSSNKLAASAESISPLASPNVSPRESSNPQRGFPEEDPNRIWEDLPKHLRIKKRSAYIRRHSDLKVSSTYRKLLLLMWKNYIVTKRRWKTSLLLILAPVLLMTILVIVVTNQRTPGHPLKVYEPFKIDTLPEKFTRGGCTTVYLRPRSQATGVFKNHLENVFANSSPLQFEFLETNQETTPENLCALIDFDMDQWKTHDSDPDSVVFSETSIHYGIRFPAVHDSGKSKSSLVSIGKEWDTRFLYPTYLVDGPREIDDYTGGHPGYFTNGFLYVQHIIALELMEIIFVQEAFDVNNVTHSKADYLNMFIEFKEKISVLLKRFPFPAAHENDDAVRIIHETLPVVLVTGFGISAIIMAFVKIKEKEMGIRILLKMYGIDDTFHRSSWILHYFLCLSITSVLITAILATNWTTHKTGLFEDVINNIFLVMIMCYAFNLVCTVTLIVCFFSRASTGCISVCFILMVSYVPYIYVKTYYNILSFWQRVLACLWFNTGLSIGCHIISEVEAIHEGISWTFVVSKDFGEFTLGWVMFILVFTAFVELFVAQYISRVFPDKGMEKLPWNYLFKSWFWSDQLPPDETRTALEKLQEASFEESNAEYFEDESNTRRRKELSLENICKYHGQLRALHRVNLVCYQGHVIVVLGDQGSGKSSLLRMLSGTLTPSAGTILMSRKDLYKNPNLGRAFVGYCPSADLLFPDLTVDETLQFFTELKGLTNRIEAYEEVERFLRITMLVDFRDTKVSELTSSSQRMLMVATAFCGGSRIVLLDDPALNLSAAQQRVLWDFTGLEKKHRTILVAMDLVHEVDSVVDKIVLLNYGQVTARGSPEFLQNKFGGGYHLELEMKYNCDLKVLDQLISRRIKGSRLFTADSKRVDFYLPQSQSSAFPGVLEELEKSMKEYGLSGLKMKFVTLEELHLSLKRQSASLDEISPTSTRAKPLFSESALNVRFNDDFTPTELGIPHYLREFRFMFMKNMKFTFRNKFLLLTASVVPLALLAVTLILVRTLEIGKRTFPRHLDYSEYKEPHILSDIYKSTNEGVYMRASVNRLLSRDNGILNRKVEYDEDIDTEVLHEYRLTSDEKKVSHLGIEISPVRESYVAPRGRTVEKVRVGLIGHFNNQPLHTPAVAVALIDNILMDYLEDFITRAVKPDESGGGAHYKRKGYSFNVTNHPLHYQAADIITYSELFIGPSYVFGILTSFSYSFLISSFIIMHIDEQDFRHLQLVSGANKIIFWGANYLWNFMKFAVFAALHVLIMVFTGLPGFSREGRQPFGLFWNMFIFILVYGFVSICLVGSHASFTFKSWGRGFSRVALTSIAGPLVMLLLIPSSQKEFQEGSRGSHSVVHNLFMFLPSYSFGVGLFYLIANEIHKEECPMYEPYKNGEACDNSNSIWLLNEFSHDGSTLQSCCFNSRGNAFSFIAYGIGRNVFVMILVGVACICQKVFLYSKKMLTLEKKWLEYRMKRWKPVRLNEHVIRDYDVLAETTKVYRGTDLGDLVIKNLSLETPACLKIDNMCLDLKKGDCFTLLGSLGAGKTTLLRALTRYPGTTHTSGDALLHGLSLTDDFHKYITSFSYSPDRNPFMDEMTGYEVLELIGTIRRIPAKTLHQQISRLIENLSLEKEINHLVETYSIGMAKKLSTAAALLGKFEVLLLDEPTHHLDPKSSKFIESKVKSLLEKGVIVIWTSHSIEQCEHVSTKMSILVNGHLRAFGTLEHLRNLHEEGFTVIVRFLLDKDMIYFTSKDRVRMENEIREVSIDEETGLPTSTASHDFRRKTLSEILVDDVEQQAYNDLAPWEQDLCPFVAYFERAFPDAILVDKQPGFIHYHVHQDKACWSELFTKMEEAKVVAEVDSYYIATTNLDQVFFNFTRGQVTFDT